MLEDRLSELGGRVGMSERGSAEGHGPHSMKPGCGRLLHMSEGASGAAMLTWCSAPFLATILILFGIGYTIDYNSVSHFPRENWR
jgi:hypothetical protein